MSDSANQAAWMNDPAARLARKNSFDGSLAMGTARFNRETGRQSPSRPFLWAIDEAAGLIRDDLTRARPCPVCGQASAETLFVKDGFSHERCPDCGLIYVGNVLRDEVLEKYWQEEQAWSGVLGSSPQMEMDRLKYLYGLELAEGLISGRRLLDVGSGPGGFVRLAATRGWRSTAQEFNRKSTQELAAEGFAVIDKGLELAGLGPNSFDLITLWEVLEHLSDPRTLLKQIRRLLEPGGLLLILVPNAGSLVTRLLHEKSHTFGGHSHLNHFNSENLTRLLNDCGFEVREMETVISELGTINNHLALADPYAGQAGTFWAELTPELIHRNLWGSRLLTLAG